MGLNNANTDNNESTDLKTDNVIERYKRLKLSTIVKAMKGYGAMHFEIKPINYCENFCGPAVTIKTKAGDISHAQKAVAQAHQGDVVVLDVGGNKGLASINYDVCRRLKQESGIAGLVVDGAIRDKEALREMGLPVLARSVSARTLDFQGHGAINVPVQCGGVLVNPGDMVVCSTDGAVVVPAGEVLKVLERAEELMLEEKRIICKLENGSDISQITQNYQRCE